MYVTQLYSSLGILGVRPVGPNDRTAGGGGEAYYPARNRRFRAVHSTPFVGATDLRRGSVASEPTALPRRSSRIPFFLSLPHFLSFFALRGEGRPEKKYPLLGWFLLSNKPEVGLVIN